MKAWEERHAYWIKDRNRFKQWIPWTTYQKNYAGENYWNYLNVRQTGKAGTSWP